MKTLISILVLFSSSLFAAVKQEELHQNTEYYIEEVLSLIPSIENMDEIGGDLIPLGIASLAAYVIEKGYGVGVLDCPTLKIDNQKVYEIILQKDPAIIGFSTTTYSLSRAVELAKKIREKLPNKLTIIGGSHANVAGLETAKEYNDFDIIAYGLDGEYITHDIVKQFSKKKI